MNDRSVLVATTIRLAAAFAGSIVLMSSGARASGTGEPSRPAHALAGIQVYFKLDPRLTQGLYMGNRWVSPPVYSRVGSGKTVTVEASARGVDATGKSVQFRPEWRAANPEMVSVTPSQGNEVAITVLRPGRSDLLVRFQDVTQTLAIHAEARDRAIVVEIAQD